MGLQWADVDFENLVIHVRRSVVMMVQGTPKTEASAKDVPLDAALAESLLKLRLTSPYNREIDWVFASHTKKGKQPLWPDILWRRYGKPAVKAAEIKKRRCVSHRPALCRIRDYAAYFCGVHKLHLFAD